MSGLIAIVGRPNVGKSALFNRIVGKRIAIVHNLPGVTRDRISAEAEWGGRPFTLVDTGGIGLLRGEKARETIAQAACDQVQLALEAADGILLVVNAQEGVVPLDEEVAARLRAAGKPVVVAVNKVDTDKNERLTPEFSALGFDRIFPVSAIHNKGVDDLMKAVLDFLPKSTGPSTSHEREEEAEGKEQGKEDTISPDPEAGPVKIAIVGRPNVGKSSIVNALTRSERVIVSPVPGTTRDAVDVPFDVETEGVRQSYLLIDTAGMRKPRRVDDSIEFFSVKRAEESIARCDVVVLVLDAEQGITEQDKKISDKIITEKRACIVVVNKWDLVEEPVREARVEEWQRREKRELKRHSRRRLTTLAEFGRWVQETLFFLDYAPVIFTSARSGFHLDRLLEAVRYVAAQWQQKVPTAILNRALKDAIETRQPVSHQGHRLKFFYATQVKQAPPTFLLFVNRKDLFTDRYKKYLTDALRTAFGFEGCPVQLIPKPRPKTIEPIRKHGPRSGPARKSSPAQK
jgi:GTPase